MIVRNVREVEPETVEQDAQGIQIRWVIGDKQGAPNFALRVFTVKPSGYTPRHRHPWEHEVFILKGRGLVHGGGQDRPFGPEDVILIPPNEEHQFRNTGSEDVEFICLIPNSGYCGSR